MQQKNTLQSSDKLISVYQYILQGMKNRSLPMDTLKTMKLPYIAFGLHAARYKQDLFAEDIQAWRYGPVIDVLLSDYTKQKELLDHYTPNYSLSEEEKQSIDTVLDIYGNKDSFKLVDLTHTEGTPWHAAYETGKKNIIPKEKVKKHYGRAYLSAKAAIGLKEVYEALART